MSALRISVPGKPVRLILLGHDEPIYHKPAEIRLMRVPLEERLARRAA